MTWSSPSLLLSTVSLHSQSCLLNKSGPNHPCVDLQGVLLVMLTFTVLELLAAAYASVFWWKRSIDSPAFIQSRIRRTGGPEPTYTHHDG